MKRNYLFLPLLLLTLSCSEMKKQLDEDLKQQLVDKLKIEFVKTFPNPTVSVDESGNVFIKQDETRYSKSYGRENILYSYSLSTTSDGN